MQTLKKPLGIKKWIFVAMLFGYPLFLFLPGFVYLYFFVNGGLLVSIVGGVLGFFFLQPIFDICFGLVYVTLKFVMGKFDKR